MNAGVRDIKADGQSAVTRRQARTSSGTVLDKDDCVDSDGADNGYAGCHVYLGGAYFYIKVCTRDFSNDIGYEGCTGWEAYGWAK
ncbi:hypothetical protein ABT075_21725 [Streptomyces sp. NPDC002677]|uniref:hypothetical protein n=1 Tax=Streptomyces sp. NPDC002677 TaxID=3154774 RepID=UPI00332867B9